MSANPLRAAIPAEGIVRTGVPSVTIAIPLDALPAVTVAAAPPALISKRNAAHVGMTAPELLRVLRAMRADPRFRESVIVHGKSFRAAPPEAIVAYLRAAPPAVAQDADEAAGDLLTELGYERTPATACSRSAGRATR